MDLTKQFFFNETVARKRLIYHHPLPLKRQRVLAKPEPNSPVHVWTKEKIRALLQSNTKLVR